MKADSDIKRDVEAELKWDPDIDPTDVAVAVAVKDGVVTLTGFVRSYTQKWQAERDVQRVSGVVEVANRRVDCHPGTRPEIYPASTSRRGRPLRCSASLRLRSRWALSTGWCVTRISVQPQEKAWTGSRNSDLAKGQKETPNLRACDHTQTIDGRAAG
jgi:hypothetical protein